MDILETVDELDDELDPTYVDLLDEPEDYGDIEYMMSRDEAEEITHAIRSAATATFVLLSRAHAQQAHKALGYETWADYVNKEFDMSASRSYQLLDMNKVVKEIESATPEGTKIKLTEAQARDIKRELPKITERIKEETRELSPDEASARAEAIVEEEREQKRLEEKAKKDRERELEEARDEARREALEEAADQLLEAHPEPAQPEEKPQAGGMSLVIAAHYSNLRHAVEVFATLPEPGEFFDSISDSSFRSIEGECRKAKEWLDEFLD